MEDNNYEISKKSGDLLNSMYDDFYNLFAPSPTELDQARKQAFENFKVSAEKMDFNKLAELYREEQENTEKANYPPRCCAFTTARAFLAIFCKNILT